MTKKRIGAIILGSPLLLGLLLGLLLASCVGYAINGKWELKKTVKEWSH